MMSKLSSLKCFSVDEYNEDKIANNERMDGAAEYILSTLWDANMYMKSDSL